MTSGRGFRGGFNPYRDNNGRFAPGGSGGGQQINDALRRAAGRGLPEEPAAASAPLPPARSMDDTAVRTWYNERTQHIPDLNTRWEASGVPAAERAARCQELRHTARVQARELMQNQEGVAGLRARDLEKYGNPDGPTFAYLVASMKNKGHVGDAVYEHIIGSSSRTNAEYNAKYAQPQQGAASA
ncbi:MAG: hypothetical protein WCI67_06625 [Chloroflexales bacterium]